MPEEPKRDIIKEIITHLNAIEEKINLLKESMEETNDLVTVNKLDIINLKNEIEKIKLSIPEVSPDTLAKLRELEKLSEKVGRLDKWKRMEKEIENLKVAMQKTGSASLNEITSALELLNQRLRKLESEAELKRHKEQHKRAIDRLKRRVETVEEKTARLIHCPGCGALVREDARFCSRCGKKI